MLGSVRQCLYTLSDIKIQLLYIYRVVPIIVGLSFKPFNERLGECTMSPFRPFLAAFSAGGCRHYNNTSFRIDQLPQRVGDILNASSLSGDASAVAGVHEQNNLGRKAR